MRRRGRSVGAARDEGQIFPIMLMSILAATGVGLAVLQAGSAHLLERRAETAADAAAIAGANRWHDSLILRPGQIGFGDPTSTQNAAEVLAEQNDAELEGIELNQAGTGWSITVSVETEGGVIGGPVEAVTERTARSTSTATVSVTPEPLEPSGDPTPVDVLAEEAGLPVHPDSALRRYQGQTCEDGVDTDRLSDAVKIAILRIEQRLRGEGLGPGLILEGGYATDACLRAQGLNAPELSPARVGDQIRLAPDQERAIELLRGRGFCEPVSHTFVAPDSPVCQGNLQDHVTVRTRLVPNP